MKQVRRLVAIISVLFAFFMVSGCGTSAGQSPVIITPIATSSTGTGGQVGGTPCPAATSVQNIDGTSVMYLSIQQKVNKGNALVLSLPGDTSQVVGLFQSPDDLKGYISRHNNARLPLYQQQMYSGPSILVLKQVNQGAYDLIILQGNAQGGKPGYDCRVAGNDQIDTILQQVTSLHAELQRVQPLKLSDYKFTLPSDENFA